MGLGTTKSLQIESVSQVKTGCRAKCQHKEGCINRNGTGNELGKYTRRAAGKRKVWKQTKGDQSYEQIVWFSSFQNVSPPYV